MILSPVLGFRLRPTFCSWIKQTRSIRPTIKIAKERFKLTIDLRQFNREEIRVKARPEYVIIEGKQERKTKSGFLIRQFVRKFKLPYGCDPATMQSKLDSDGILTITAPRKSCDLNLPCERVVPISYDEKPDEIPKAKPTEGVCDKFIKSNPKDAYLKPPDKTKKS